VHICAGTGAGSVVTELPRETYRTDLDAAYEAATARVIEAWSGCMWMKVGEDRADKMKSVCDGALVRDGVVRGFAEVKGQRERAFGEFPNFVTSARKVRKLQAVHELFALPVWLFTYFGTCGSVAGFDVVEAFEEVPGWGRRDRGSAGDIEVGARYLWKQLRIIGTLDGIVPSVAEK